MGSLRRGCRGGGARGSELIARVAGAVRWLPPAAALVYAFVLLRRLPEIIGQLLWNADFVSGMVMAESAGTAGKSGRAVAIQAGWFWYDLATLHLPFHRDVWEYTPFVMAMVALALITWTSWRLAGPFAGVLAASIGIAASPVVVGTQLAQSYHGTTWLGAAVLAAYLARILSGPMTRPAVIAWSIVVSLVAGYATATDPLLVPAGDVPFVLTLITLWRWRPEALRQDGVATAAGVALVSGVAVLANGFAGVGSSYPRGLTHLVPPNHVAGNARQLMSGIFEVAGMPHLGSALGVVLGVILVAALLAPFAWLIASHARGMSPAVLAVTVFWTGSTLCVAAAFFFSDIPADFGQNSSRYLVSMFFAAAATVPLWTAGSTLRAALVAAPAVLLILANAASVDRAAADRSFEPTFTPSMSAIIAFLEQHGLDRGYTAYEFASPITWNTDFALRIYPVTQDLVAPDDQCGSPAPGAVCPFAYNSLSQWYRGSYGPTFILVAAGVVRLEQPPPPGLDTVVAMYQLGNFSIYVYADDVAGHMGTPRRFTKPLF